MLTDKQQQNKMGRLTSLCSTQIGTVTSSNPIEICSVSISTYHTAVSNFFLDPVYLKPTYIFKLYNK
jgi:hypothetical protein